MSEFTIKCENGHMFITNGKSHATTYGPLLKDTTFGREYSNKVVDCSPLSGQQFGSQIFCGNDGGSDVLLNARTLDRDEANVGSRLFKKDRGSRCPILVINASKPDGLNEEWEVAFSKSDSQVNEQTVHEAVLGLSQGDASNSKLHFVEGSYIPKSGDELKLRCWGSSNVKWATNALHTNAETFAKAICISLDLKRED